MTELNNEISISNLDDDDDHHASEFAMQADDDLVERHDLGEHIADDAHLLEQDPSKLHWKPCPRFLPTTPENRAAWAEFGQNVLTNWAALRERKLAPFLRPYFLHYRLPLLCPLEYLVYLLIFTVHFLVLLSALLRKENAKEMSKALGHLLQTDLYFLLMLGLRNTPLKWIFGMSSEKLGFWHEIMAYIFVSYSTIHGILAVIYYWDDLLYLLRDSEDFFGVLAYACFVLLSFFSLPVFRRVVWEISRVAHFLGMLAIIFLFFHHDGGSTVAAVVVFLLPYCYDYYLRIREIMARPRPRIVSVDSFGTLFKIRVAAPHLRSFPGAWALLNLSAISSFQQHPFSIAYVSDGGRQSQLQIHEDSHDSTPVATFYVRALGNWTDSLAGICNTTPPQSLANTFLSIEGPYGHMRFPPLNYDHIILFAAGNGLAAHLSIVQAFREQAREHQRIVVFWSVRLAGEIELFKQDIDRNALQNEEWQIYVTGHGEYTVATDIDLAVSHDKFPGRLNPHDLLSSIRVDCQQSTQATTAGLYIVGPRPFVDSTLDAASILNNQTNSLFSSTFRFDICVDYYEI